MDNDRHQEHSVSVYELCFWACIYLALLQLSLEFLHVILNMSTYVKFYVMHKSIYKNSMHFWELPNHIILIIFEHLIKGLKVLKRIKPAGP